MRKRHSVLFSLLAAFFFVGLFYGHETITNNDLLHVDAAIKTGDSLSQCRARWTTYKNVRVDPEGPSGDPTHANDYVVVLRLNNRILSSDSYLTLVFENGALKSKSYWDTWKWFD